MANENINKVNLTEVELYENGERANAENLNRPISQLINNQIMQNNMLTEIYDIMVSSVLKNIELTGDGIKNTFDIDFYKDSISCFIEGIKINSSDYTLNYDANIPEKGISVTFNIIPDDGDEIAFITMGKEVID
jgi:spore germination protein YaaH